MNTWDDQVPDQGPDQVPDQDLKEDTEPLEDRGGPFLGIVIPTLDEGASLPSLLDDLSRLSLPHDVVVADGGSSDRTLDLARSGGARVVLSPKGRGKQMNAGAKALHSPWILFLHADSRVPPESRQALESWFSGASNRDVGFFRFALEGDHWFWRFIELGQGIREKLHKLIYGDQGLLVSRALFEEAGGFPELPLMEDVEMVRTLRKLGRIRRIPVPLLTSPRRYKQDGQWRSWIRNTLVISLYLAGVSPEKLARFYGPLSSGETTEVGRPWRETLLVFAKAPVPGQVKTRLAKDLGEDEAARIYNLMGRRIVDQIRGGKYRTVICFDPPEARSSVANWLGGEGLAFRPQSQGDLGNRMETAFSEAFRDSDRVVVVGTDAPAVDSSLVEAAFSSLDKADLVLGPATDGGYYLLGLWEPAPGLFEGIPWSTEAVLESTRARARELGLREVLLPVLGDVDTARDLRELNRRSNPPYPP